LFRVAQVFSVSEWILFSLVERDSKGRTAVSLNGSMVTYGFRLSIGAEMAPQPPSESTEATQRPLAKDPGSTQTYFPSAEDLEISASERETRLRLTGGSNAAESTLAGIGAVDHAGRFPIVREIGRGGMGVVLEANDTQLGRRLAVKVLLEPHQNDERLVRRFLDEARICGQLQHPGIVPIHEIGWLPDRRPFFTMKLIQGQTLASLVQARTSPTADLPRFIAIFEQVCLTMAYAHAHGIIHRDLKPSNIMVGSFGEVQVMDWGLAKVLKHSKPFADGTVCDGDTAREGAVANDAGHDADATTSVAGAVIGTPGFMSPEQARGESTSLDARCDVFGLGAILCVILTGKPPYDGTTHPQVYQQAVQGDLFGAYERLAACAADQELVDIARRCLAADASDRPHDAGVVALAITEYRASVAERLHEAELERAAAEAKAEGERKSRRLTLALAAATLAFLLLGVGAWFWLDRERAQKRELFARGIEEQLRQAERLREKGKTAPIGELSPWTEALAHVRAARENLTYDRDMPALRQRLEDLSTALEVEFRDRQMLAQLETIRLIKSQAKSFDRHGAAEYAAAFAAYGVDVEHLSLEEAVEEIRNRAIAPELAAALDDWADSCDDAKQRKHLLDVAGLADGDAWRKRLRAAMLARDRDTLADAARAPEVDHLPATTLYLLGQALANVGDSVESIRLLQRAQRLHPDDFWINFRLALQLELDNPPRSVEAVRFYTAALAVRKQSAGAHLSLGVALAGSKALDEAIAEYREALNLQKDYPLAHYNLGNALKDKRSFDEALAEYREAIRLKPNYVEAYNNLGSLLADLDRTEEAIEAFSKALQIAANHASSHHNLALAWMRLGRIDEALDACRRAVHYEGNAGYYNTLGLLLEKKDRLNDAVAAYKRAIELDKNYPVSHYNLGLLYLRLGQPALAQAEIQESLRLRPQNATAWYNLGTTAINRGENEKAISALKKAVEIDPRYTGAWLNLGTAYANIGQYDSSIEAYRQALRVNPKYLAAWTSLGATYLKKGDFNSAIDAYKEGVTVAKDDADAHNNLGSALAQRGRLAEAAASFREAIRLQPIFPRAYNNLGNALGAQGEFEEADQAYKKAIELDPRYTKAYLNRGQTLLDWGKLAEAVAVYRESLAIEPENAWGRCLLGLALKELGQLSEACDELAKGHELGVRQKGWNKPSEHWLSQCRQLIEAEKKLPALQKGEYRPANNDERILLATLCLQAHPYYADAVDLYQAAFETSSALLERHRSDAARAAVLAGCGKGDGADKRTAAERTAWRKQGLAWLREEFEQLRTRSEQGSEVLRGTVRKTLRRWKSDAAFAGVCEAKSLAALPKDESQAWRDFWNEVGELLQISP
jgi:tetratricopeptide (TPR) repeat protein